MKSELILIVDPDKSTAGEISTRLQRAGYECLLAAGAADGLRLVSTLDPDLVISEIELPDRNGFDLCREVLRISEERPAAFVFYTTRDAEIDLVVGFEVGADDYVSKRIGTLELSLRVEAILKRRRPFDGDRMIQVGDIVIDSDQSIVTYQDQSVSLSPTEFQILLVLARQAGTAMHRKDIVAQAWPEKIGVMRRTVDAHIKSIRGKLTGMGVQINTVRGFGYSLRPDLDENEKKINL